MGTIPISALGSRKIDEPVVITKRGKTLGWFIPGENIPARKAESILATLEELSNPRTMRQIEKIRAGKGKFLQWTRT